MMWWILLGFLCVLTRAERLPLAKSCNVAACKLPDCRCSSTEIPGGLSRTDTPQFVTVTFDDAVTGTNIGTYRNIFNGRFNSNGCPMTATFYICHEYTDYVLANELYNKGHGIAVHSISHKTDQTYWAGLTYEESKAEFVDMRTLISHFANIPIDDIKGVRAPFLQSAGNTTFKVIADWDLGYDCSMPTTTRFWPYTLDYASTQACDIPPCPTASIPGAVVQPMVSWIDLQGFPCSMVDACYYVPDRNDADAWYRFIKTNFERHYNNNRAPFGFYVHEWYLAVNPAIKNGLERFLDYISSLNDAFVVTSQEVLEWVRNPISLSQYQQTPCRRHVPTSCDSCSCGPLSSNHTSYGLNYWMRICNTCPRVYPWVGNPLGK